MRLYGAALVLAFSYAGFAAQPADVLARMDQAAPAFTGLTADIEKVDHNEIIKDDEIERGTITLKRAKAKQYKALFVVNGANAKQVAYSGRTVDIYYPKANTIDRYNVEKQYGGLFDKYMLLGFGATTKELSEVYNVAPAGEENVAGQKTLRLDLTPRKPDTGMGLTKAELWISEDTGMAIRQKLFIRGGETHLITYTNMKINPNIPASATTLKPPPGVKIQYPQK